MDSNRCSQCKQEKELVCCKDCMWTLIMQRISESMAGDVADRVYLKIDDRIERLEELIKSLLNDKQIIWAKKGRRLIKV